MIKSKPQKSGRHFNKENKKKDEMVKDFADPLRMDDLLPVSSSDNKSSVSKQPLHDLLRKGRQLREAMTRSLKTSSFLFEDDEEEMLVLAQEENDDDVEVKKIMKIIEEEKDGTLNADQSNAALEPTLFLHLNVSSLLWSELMQKKLKSFDRSLFEPSSNMAKKKKMPQHLSSIRFELHCSLPWTTKEEGNHANPTFHLLTMDFKMNESMLDSNLVTKEHCIPIPWISSQSVVPSSTSLSIKFWIHFVKPTQHRASTIKYHSSMKQRKESHDRLLQRLKDEEFVGICTFIPSMFAENHPTFKTNVFFFMAQSSTTLKQKMATMKLEATLSKYRNEVEDQKKLTLSKLAGGPGPNRLKDGEEKGNQQKLRVSSPMKSSTLSTSYRALPGDILQICFQLSSIHQLHQIIPSDVNESSYPFISFTIRHTAPMQPEMEFSTKIPLSTTTPSASRRQRHSQRSSMEFQYLPSYHQAIIPYVLTEETLLSFHPNRGMQMVIEVWGTRRLSTIAQDKVRSSSVQSLKKKLIGLVKFPLTSLYESLHKKEWRKQRYPILGFDGKQMLINPFTGEIGGYVRGFIAIGTPQQIHSYAKEVKSALAIQSLYRGVRSRRKYSSVSQCEIQRQNEELNQNSSEYTKSSSKSKLPSQDDLHRPPENHEKIVKAPTASFSARAVPNSEHHMSYHCFTIQLKDAFSVPQIFGCVVKYSVRQKKSNMQAKSSIRCFKRNQNDDDQNRELAEEEDPFTMWWDSNNAILNTSSSFQYPTDLDEEIEEIYFEIGVKSSPGEDEQFIGSFVLVGACLQNLLSRNSSSIPIEAEHHFPIQWKNVEGKKHFSSATLSAFPASFSLQLLYWQHQQEEKESVIKENQAPPPLTEQNQKVLSKDHLLPAKATFIIEIGELMQIRQLYQMLMVQASSRDQNHLYQLQLKDAQPLFFVECPMYLPQGNNQDDQNLTYFTTSKVSNPDFLADSCEQTIHIDSHWVNYLQTESLSFQIYCVNANAALSKKVCFGSVTVPLASLLCRPQGIQGHFPIIMNSSQHPKSVGSIRLNLYFLHHRECIQHPLAVTELSKDHRNATNGGNILYDYHSIDEQDEEEHVLEDQSIEGNSHESNDSSIIQMEQDEEYEKGQDEGDEDRDSRGHLDSDTSFSFEEDQDIEPQKEVEELREETEDMDGILNQSIAVDTPTFQVRRLLLIVILHLFNILIRRWCRFTSKKFEI